MLLLLFALQVHRCSPPTLRKRAVKFGLANAAPWALMLWYKHLVQTWKRAYNSFQHIYETVIFKHEEMNRYWLLIFFTLQKICLQFLPEPQFSGYQVTVLKQAVQDFHQCFLPTMNNFPVSPLLLIPSLLNVLDKI